MSFTFVDLFSGIGGFRQAADSLNGISMGYSEIDKSALSTYQKNYNDPGNHNLGDIQKIKNLKKVDLIVGGVPCQSWSVAGKMHGFSDPRGKLWFDAINIVKMSQPKVFVFENVKGLHDPRNRKNLNLIIDHFDNLGYKLKYSLLNSFDFGLPQNRSRIFIVGFNKKFSKKFDKFSFPEPQKKSFQLSEFLDSVPDKKILKVKLNPNILFNGNIPPSRNIFQKNDELNDFFTFCDTRNGHSTIHSWELQRTSKREKLICLTILKKRRSKNYGTNDGNPISYVDLKFFIDDLEENELEKLVNKSILKKVGKKFELINSKNSSGLNGIYRIYLPNSKIFSTLTATGTKDFIATDYIESQHPKDFKDKFLNNIFKKKKFRQITPREGANIQGFSKKTILDNNEKQALKQLGNAVSPPVVKNLLKNIIETGVFK